VWTADSSASSNISIRARLSNKLNTKKSMVEEKADKSSNSDMRKVRSSHSHDEIKEKDKDKSEKMRKHSKMEKNAVLKESEAEDSDDDDEEEVNSIQASPVAAPRAQAAPTKTSNLDVSTLIKAQSFNGSFDYATLHVLIPTLNASDIKDNFPSGVTGNSDKLVEAIFITAIICKYFANVFGSQKTLWELVVKKAKTWIKKESEAHSISTSIDWDVAAQKFLSSHGF